VAGIAGAVVAVPITAALSRAIPELRKDEDESPASRGVT
jgi:predicted PurR-regulated permease PerM